MKATFGNVEEIVSTWHLMIQRRFDSESPWVDHIQIPSDMDAGQARALMGRLIPVLPSSEFRLVEVNVTVHTEVL